MREAIRLAAEGMEQGAGGPFGAVIVRAGDVVGRGWNGVLAGPDPTAHAEVQALRDACSSLSRFELSDCVIYSSCEPCPMCLAAIHWARLDGLCFAADRADAAAIGFDDARIAARLGQVQPSSGLKAEQFLRDEAWAVMQAWPDRPGRCDY